MKEYTREECETLANAVKASSPPQHTPGPWIAAVIDKDGEYTEWVVLTNPPPRLSGIPPIATIGLVTETGAANARLIAAAPELLAALKTAQSVLGHLLQSDSGTYVNAQRQVRDAIAKAEGK